jgi:hypothetical protein
METRAIKWINISEALGSGDPTATWRAFPISHAGSAQFAIDQSWIAWLAFTGSVTQVATTYDILFCDSLDSPGPHTRLSIELPHSAIHSVAEGGKRQDTLVLPHKLLEPVAEVGRIRDVCGINVRSRPASLLPQVNASYSSRIEAGTSNRSGCLKMLRAPLHTSCSENAILHAKFVLPYPISPSLVHLGGDVEMVDYIFCFEETTGSMLYIRAVHEGEERRYVMSFAQY